MNRIPRARPREHVDQRASRMLQSRQCRCHAKHFQQAYRRVRHAMVDGDHERPLSLACNHRLPVVVVARERRSELDQLLDGAPVQRERLVHEREPGVDELVVGGRVTRELIASGRRELQLFCRLGPFRDNVEMW